MHRVRGEQERWQGVSLFQLRFEFFIPALERVTDLRHLFTSERERKGSV